MAYSESTKNCHGNDCWPIQSPSTLDMNRFTFNRDRSASNDLGIEGS
jgi:hypothetical protein